MDDDVDGTASGDEDDAQAMDDEDEAEDEANGASDADSDDEKEEGEEVLDTLIHFFKHGITILIINIFIKLDGFVD